MKDRKENISLRSFLYTPPMNKKIIFLVLLCCSGFLLRAISVDPATARRAGLNFYYERINLHADVPYKQLTVREEFAEHYLGKVVYYAFNFSDQGFVIVSADDAVTPVLAYSFDGVYTRENQPPQFMDWMGKYALQINASMEKQLNPEPEVKAAWDHLNVSGPEGLGSLRNTMTDVLPLLVSTWDQGGNYNLLCPSDPAGPSGHVWAGCVATAMSQIMYYYRYPNTGLGSHCYVPAGYPQQCADFGNTTYNWGEMMNSVYFTDSAVATLIYHAGVAVNMMYSPNGSGAYSEDAAQALISNFKYHPNTTLLQKDNYTETEWDNILMDNLNHQRPMYYDGYGTGGHAFNVDGYQGTNYFHFNWGWSGSFNGYFYLNNLNPGGDDFTNGQGAIVNLYPDTTAYTYPSYCTGQTVRTEMFGTFEDGSGVKNYQANANCSWLIAPESESDSITSITINFSRFDTEEGTDM